MLGRFFKSKQTANGLSAMQMADIPAVVRIIDETDEDDAEAAELSLIANRCEGMYVLRDDGQIIGVTGTYQDEQVDDIAWLSWTYLTEAKQGQGFGRYMIEAMLDKLDAQNVRQIFIASSDYCEAGEEIYADAHRFYQAMGAELAMRVPDYHSAGEAMLIYQLVNQRIQKSAGDTPEPPNGLAFTEPQIAAESEDTAELHWMVEGERVSGVEQAKVDAKSLNARQIVTALPADLSDYAAAALEQSGFAEVGRLANYYDVGLDQVWWLAKL